MNSSSFAVTLLLGLAAASSGCEPWQCDASTCINGCCDSSGTCIISGGKSQCGLRGAACASCATCTGGVCGCEPGLALVAGKCTCTSTSCTGCCETNSFSTQCRLASSQSSSSCGTRGATCRSCSSFETCGTTGCASCGTSGDSCTPGNGDCCSSYYCSYDSFSGGYRCRL